MLASRIVGTGFVRTAPAVAREAGPAKRARSVRARETAVGMATVWKVRAASSLCYCVCVVTPTRSQNQDVSVRRPLPLAFGECTRPLLARLGNERWCWAWWNSINAGVCECTKGFTGFNCQYGAKGCASSNGVECSNNGLCREARFVFVSFVSLSVRAYVYIYYKFI